MLPAAGRVNANQRRVNANQKKAPRFGAPRTCHESWATTPVARDLAYFFAASFFISPAGAAVAVAPGPEALADAPPEVALAVVLVDACAVAPPAAPFMNSAK